MQMRFLLSVTVALVLTGMCHGGSVSSNGTVTGSKTEVVDGIKWRCFIGDYNTVYNDNGARAYICADEWAGESDASAVPRSTTGGIVIPAMLGGKPVAQINPMAFYKCTNIVSITIPSSIYGVGVGYIGEGAVFCASGSTDFKLKCVIIENPSCQISKGAFTACSRIEYVKIPQCMCTDKGQSSGMSTLNAFMYSCNNLKKVEMVSGVRSIGNYAFCNASGENSASGVAYIYYSSESYRREIEEFIIPNTVTSIGQWAFRNCYAIQMLTIPSSVQSIGDKAFGDCTGLKVLVMPRNVTEGIGVTTNCSSSLEVCRYTLSQGVLSVDSAPAEAFQDFEKTGDRYASVVVEDSARYIGARSFAGKSDLRGLTIGNSVGHIDSGAFDGCAALSELTIPGNVKSIGTEAFRGCRGITNLTLESGVESIGASAFEGCTNLVCVTIPDSVTSIDMAAFRNCSSLKEVYMSEMFMNSLDASVFEGCDSDFTDYYRYCDEEENVPNPPMAEDPNISITPTTRNFGVNGGGNAIITSGSGTWTAAVSDPWITLNTTSGNVGHPVAYAVSATTNVEPRIGYVYVSGYAHTVTQDGVGATLDHSTATYETEGGREYITVSAPNRIAWKVRTNVEWIIHDTASGMGEGEVEYVVMPYNEVATRQGTLTVAGNTFTVFQYGRRMKLSTYTETRDYETHVIPITVNALAITQWNVAPNNSWISVVDAGNGQGGDLVTIAIAENPSYRARTGTVTIGTETFTVTQQGRPTEALSFTVNPTASTASVNGANGMIAVLATPDLPWTAASGANWLTVYATTATGAGNGNVVYNASPNPTLFERTGTVTVTPEAASGMAAKTHTVTQPAAESALSSNGYEFEASGESCSVRVSVADIVQWEIENTNGWITVNGNESRVGPGEVVLQASANDTVYPRSGTVKIAGKTFSVSQKARGVELEYDTKLFSTDGGYESISIHPDGNSDWTAVASDATWITIFQGDSGTGDGEILYIVAPYVGDGTARTGWIEVGDKKVYITQRAYDLNIEPNGTNVVGNVGAGEFGVSASTNDIWTAIVTEPWITLVSGYDSGTGSGTVRFIYTENNTGKTRTGKILVNGEVYTLEQRARQMVAIAATAEHGGHVSGGGSYDLGTQVTLEAVPDSGYKFSYWTGAVSSMQNPLTVTADVAKSYTAVFETLPIAFTSVVSDTNGVTLAWNNLAWAGTYRICRGVTSVPSSAMVLVELPNDGNCTYLDETGEVDTEYWYWIEAEGPSDEVMSDPMTGRKEKPIVISPITYENLRGATNPNPATYREGTLVSFQNPGTLTGYTFAGWTPSQITADMTGAQTVRAAWTANGYSITYNANGGSGTMGATAATYDSEATVAANGFMWAGHVFAGWATNATGEVIYAAGQPVTNLTAQSSGVVTLYAVWELAAITAPVISPADGATFSENFCTVTITCVTEGATIYYSTNGRTPRFTDANRYTGPFLITDTTTVIAVAVLDDQEEYAEATITKVDAPQMTLAGVLDVANLSSVTTGGDAEWAPVEYADAKIGGSCARSGAVGMEQSSHLEVTVQGKGTLTFWWKVSCEPDPRGRHSYDNLSYAVDGTVVAWIDGETGWAQQSVTFDTDGAHTVCWTYATDDWEEPGYSDCGWVDGVVWTPEEVIIIDPLPEVATDSNVTNALAGAADETRLRTHLSGKAQYDLFRAWVNARGLDHQTVKNSARAWFSYAIGANGLVEKVFQNDDVTIKSLNVAASGGFSFEVEVKDVSLGAAATAENLATVFGIQGASSLREGTFSSKNVTVTLGVSANGRLLVTATPKRAHDTFFIRVRRYPDADAEDDEDDGEDDDPTVNPSDTHASVQLWEDGPYWATTNIGAEEPEDSGYYFWWGDTIGYKREGDFWVASDGSSSNFSFHDVSPNSNGLSAEGYDRLKSEGWIDANDFLASEHDAAQVQWGGGWRMPTMSEVDGLRAKCDWRWTTRNGVLGYVVCGRGDYAAASIFLPAAGYGSGNSFYDAGEYGCYWTRNRMESQLYCGSGFIGYEPTCDYSDGSLIRPVKVFPDPGRKSYEVTFDANGGVVAGKTTRAVGTLPPPTREGHIFDGWWTAANGGTQVKSSTVVTTDVTYYAHWMARTDAPRGNKVQLWEGGPYWAETNIGAEKPEDYGYCFWWGDTIGYTREGDVWVASDGSSPNISSDWRGVPTIGKDNVTLRGEGWLTAADVLAPEHDAAQVQWGDGWRMPTHSELVGLSFCNWTWTTVNGVSGYVIVGRDAYASNSIFLPCNGASVGVGSSVPLWDPDCYYDRVGGIYFDSRGYDGSWGLLRYEWFAVRPVQGFTN